MEQHSECYETMEEAENYIEKYSKKDNIEKVIIVYKKNTEVVF